MPTINYFKKLYNYQNYNAKFKINIYICIQYYYNIIDTTFTKKLM